MRVTNRFKFIQLPTPEQVLEKVRAITGLIDIFYTTKNGNFVFQHPFFVKPELYVIIDDEVNEIVVWTKTPQVNYLKETLLLAIKCLGGAGEIRITESAQKPWSEVKNSYKEWSIVDMTGFAEE